MYKSSLSILFLLCLLCFSCKSIKVTHETQTKTTQSIELGTIGEDKIFLLEEDYNSTAIPDLTKPIKLSLSVIEFNNMSYKAFAKTNSKKQTPLTLHYADSLTEKPKFLKLEIADRVTVLETLNSKHNKDVKNYISNKKDAHLISAVSIAFNETIMNTLLKADALFLEQTANKLFVIKAYKDNVVLDSFGFNDGVVFAYKASNFCWQEDKTQQLSVVDIVESSGKCPNNSYRNAKRAQKMIDYFKL